MVLVLRQLEHLALDLGLWLIPVLRPALPLRLALYLALPLFGRLSLIRGCYFPLWPFLLIVPPSGSARSVSLASKYLFLPNIPHCYLFIPPKYEKRCSALNTYEIKKGANKQPSHRSLPRSTPPTTRLHAPAPTMPDHRLQPLPPPRTALSSPTAPTSSPIPSPSRSSTRR